jgi:hypothetical protein
MRNHAGQGRRRGYSVKNGIAANEPHERSTLMKIANELKQQLVFWGLVLGLWGLLVLAFAGQLVFTAGVEWRPALSLSFRDWFPWVLLGPVVAWLGFRFPFERGKLALSIPIHVVACMGAVFLCDAVARRNPAPLPGPLPPGAPQFRFRGGDRGGSFPDRPPLAGPMNQPESPQRRGVPLPGERAGVEGSPRAGLPGEPLPFPPRQRPEGDPADRPPLLQPEPRPGFFLNALAMRGKFNIPIYWVIVSITQALRFYRRSEDRERQAAALEARLLAARLEALRMQLHPHFLFNTLNAISTLVHKDPHAADEMIANLSELLRATLDSSSQEVTLRRELEFLDRYLEIQQTRFGDRLRVEKEVDAGALDGLVPALILQPIVENAVRHGIEPAPIPGSVRIAVRREGASLKLRVADSGGGPRAKSGSEPGIGLANTRARLQTLYGEAASLTFTSGSEPGFAVEILLPFHEQPASAA